MTNWILNGSVAALALLPALAASAQTSVGADASRIGRSAVPKAPELQELYDFDAAAKTLGDATFPYESRLHRAREATAASPSPAATLHLHSPARANG